MYPWEKPGRAASPLAAAVAHGEVRWRPLARDNRDFRDKRDRDGRDMMIEKKKHTIYC
jgi:hypothetical protein